ncbi:hypothetical protein LEP1GSC126_1886 [Leptospira kirschneri str. 200801774]|nr:hypothetical protein LEP1GSC126_1886 [Leptospira kirschneri str. 200801774]
MIQHCKKSVGKYSNFIPRINPFPFVYIQYPIFLNQLRYAHVHKEKKPLFVIVRFFPKPRRPKTPKVFATQLDL